MYFINTQKNHETYYLLFSLFQVFFFLKIFLVFYFQYLILSLNTKKEQVLVPPLVNISFEIEFYNGSETTGKHQRYFLIHPLFEYIIWRYFQRNRIFKNSNYF